MVPIGHPNAPHNIHAQHSIPPMANAPAPTSNNLPNNQSNKVTTSVVGFSAIQYVDRMHKFFVFFLFLSETKLYAKIYISWPYESSFSSQVQC